MWVLGSARRGTIFVVLLHDAMTSQSEHMTLPFSHPKKATRVHAKGTSVSKHAVTLVEWCRPDRGARSWGVKVGVVRGGIHFPKELAALNAYQGFVDTNSAWSGPLPC
jgi:hypothetical protein